MSVIVFGSVFGVAALIWIVWPLVGRRGASTTLSAGGGVRDDLAERTLLLYQELEEIDLEHEQGDLTADEYESLRAAQKQRVLSVLEERQSEKGALSDAAGLDETSALSYAIEEEILRIRARRRGQQHVPADQ